MTRQEHREYTAHDELLLQSKISTNNQEVYRAHRALALYMTHLMDVDAGRVIDKSIESERGLANQIRRAGLVLEDIASDIEKRATARETGNVHPLL